MEKEKKQSKAAQILMTMAAFVIVIAGVMAAKSIIIPFLLAAFISIISAPLLFWMQSKGLPKWLAVLIVIIIVFIIGFLLFTLIGSSVRDFTRNIPFYEVRLKQQTVSIISLLDKIGLETKGLDLSQIFNPSSAMKLTSSLLNGLGNALTNIFLLLMMVIFMLLEASSFPVKLNAIMGGSENNLDRFSHFIGTVKQYMVIKTLISLITGFLVFIILKIIGVDYPLLWGVLAFAFNFVPNIGSIIAAIPAVLLTIIQLGFIKAVLVALIYLAINVIMGNFIEPRFMGRGLGLSTLVVFLSLIFWGWVLGPVGMLLSVPLTITAKIALDSSEETRWISLLLGPDKIMR